MLFRSCRPLLLLTLLLPFAAGADCMGPYPPSIVKTFDQGCVQNPTMESFCVCLMDKVQKNIPLADFIEIGNSSAGIQNDPRFQSASKECASKLPGAASTPAAVQKSTLPAGALPRANFGPGSR